MARFHRIQRERDCPIQAHFLHPQMGNKTVKFSCLLTLVITSEGYCKWCLSPETVPDVHDVHMYCTPTLLPVDAISSVTTKSIV